MNIKVNEYIIYGGYGVGQVLEIKPLVIENKTQNYYIIKFKKLSVNIPESELHKNGLRKLSDANTINSALSELENKETSFSHKNWNQKQRDFLNKIRGGNLIEIAQVGASLKNQPKLSFGEKQILQTCIGLIQEEASLVLKTA